jgi:hypothetical protein
VPGRAFLDAPTLAVATPASYTCRNMARGRRVELSFEATLTHPLNKKVWYILTYAAKSGDGKVLVDKKGLGASGTTAHNIFEKLESRVPGDGDIALDVQMTQCQPDHHTDWDRCTVAPTGPNTPIWRINLID